MIAYSITIAMKARLILAATALACVALSARAENLQYGPPAAGSGSAPCNAFGSSAGTCEQGLPIYTVAANVPNNGSTDATAALQTQLNSISAAGGGTLMLGPYRYAVSTITVPVNVVVMGNLNSPGFNSSGCYNTDPYMLIVSGTITMSAHSGLRGLELYSAAPYALGCPTDARSVAAVVKAFAGTGVSVTAIAPHVDLSSLFILGFTTGVSVANTSGFYFHDLAIDATNGVSYDNVHDTSFSGNLHGYEYLSAKINTNTPYQISAFSNDGTGKVQVTCTATCASTTPSNSGALLNTGDVVNVAGATVASGQTNVDNRWTITVVDATHYTLDGSSYVASTPTGNTTSGSCEITTISSLSNLVTGELITDSAAAIPAGATIAAINDGATKIVLDSAHCATGTQSGDTLTITPNTTFSATGNAYLTYGFRRAGDFIKATNLEYLPINGIGEYGWDTGIHISTGAIWFAASNIGLDATPAVGDPNTIAILCDQTCSSPAIGTGFIGAYSVHVKVNTSYSPAAALRLTGMQIAKSTTAIPIPFSVNVQQGSLVVSGSIMRGASMYVADLATQVSIGGSDITTTTVTLEQPSDAGLIYNGAAPISGMNNVAQFTGSASNRGVQLGADVGGTGGLVLNKHDSSATGGNAIGINAADLSDMRNANTQVASGPGSLNAGQFNTASGASSVAVGNSNVASGTGSTAVGYNNTSSGTVGFVGGQGAQDKGLIGRSCWTSNAVGGAGKYQTCTQTIRISTSGSAAVRLTSDAAAAGTTNCLNLPNNSGWGLRIDIEAWDVTTVTKNEFWPDWAMQLTRGANAAATALVTATTPTPLTNGTVTGSTVTAAADTTQGCLNLQFTPPTSNTDTWDVVARIVSTEAQ